MSCLHVLAWSSFNKEIQIEFYETRVEAEHGARRRFALEARQFLNDDSFDPKIEFVLDPKIEDEFEMAVSRGASLATLIEDFDELVEFSYVIVSVPRLKQPERGTSK